MTAVRSASWGVPYLDPRDFGLRTDGTGDAGVAYNTMFAEAQSQGFRGEFVVPGGLQRVVTPIVFPLSMQGLRMRGPGAFWDDPSLTSPATVRNQAVLAWDGAAGGTMINGVGQLGLKLEGLTLTGVLAGGSGGRAGVLFQCSGDTGGSNGSGDGNVDHCTFWHADRAFRMGDIPTDPDCADWVVNKSQFWDIDACLDVQSTNGVNYNFINPSVVGCGGLILAPYGGHFFGTNVDASFCGAGNAASSAAFTASIGAATNAFTASISGLVMTVSSVSSGILCGGQAPSATALAAGTTIVRQLTGTAGGAGTWRISPAQTLTSRAFTTSYTAMTVSAVTAGALKVGQTISGTNLIPGTVLLGFGTGVGATGVYCLNNAQSISSESMTGAIWLLTALNLNDNSSGVGFDGFSVEQGTKGVANLQGSSGFAKFESFEESQVDQNVTQIVASGIRLKLEGGRIVSNDTTNPFFQLLPGPGSQLTKLVCEDLRFAGVTSFAMGDWISRSTNPMTVLDLIRCEYGDVGNVMRPGNIHSHPGRGDKVRHRVRTTTAGQLNPTLDGGVPEPWNVCPIPVDSVMSVTATITAMQEDFSQQARWVRRALIMNQAGTLTLIGAIENVGTDGGSNSGSPPSGWVVSSNSGAITTLDMFYGGFFWKVSTGASINVDWGASYECEPVGLPNE